MSERSLCVLAYIDRVMEPEGPIWIDLAAILRTHRVPTHTMRMIDGQIRYLSAAVHIAEAEANAFRAQVHYLQTALEAGSR